MFFCLALHVNYKAKKYAEKCAVCLCSHFLCPICILPYSQFQRGLAGTEETRKIREVCMQSQAEDLNWVLLTVRMLKSPAPFPTPHPPFPPSPLLLPPSYVSECEWNPLSRESVEKVRNQYIRMLERFLSSEDFKIRYHCPKGNRFSAIKHEM